ncbi:MAG: pirin family protein [Desulfobacterium sp.]|nr:pirin family protein [Desulfobacterium sp.]
MEIITIVLNGEMTHADSMGNKAVIKPGDVQRMPPFIAVILTKITPWSLMAQPDAGYSCTLQRVRYRLANKRWHKKIKQGLIRTNPCPLRHQHTPSSC